jgi:thioredoxin reductase
MQSIETAIVGAGPYGLSISAHLRAAGVMHEVFGDPLESWRDFMPRGMLLRSEPFASNLWDPNRRFTYERYLNEKNIPYRKVRDPVSIERFLDYASWFRKNAAGAVRNVKVRRIRRDNELFVLELVDGSAVQARRVVLATGHMAFRNVPAELSGLQDGLCIHSTALTDLQKYAGRDVTVIGAGQSALESAALLRENGATVRLIARQERLTWNDEPRPNPSWIGQLRNPEAGLGSGWRSWAVSELPFLYRRLFDADKRHRFFLNSWGPSGAWWLRERFEGKIEALLGHELQSAQELEGRVRITVKGPQGVREIVTDQLVAATGFLVALDRIDCLDDTLKKVIAREGPYPALNAHFETSVPDLFIVGFASAPVFGPVLRFMFGAKHAAPAVTRRLLRRSSGLGNEQPEIVAT